MPVKCTFHIDGEKVTEYTGKGPNEAVARRAAINQFDWESDHEDVTVKCE